VLSIASTTQPAQSAFPNLAKLVGLGLVGRAMIHNCASRGGRLRANPATGSVKRAPAANPGGMFEGAITTARLPERFVAPVECFVSIVTRTSVALMCQFRFLRRILAFLDDSRSLFERVACDQSQNKPP
jgi:hypothetical protein